MHDEARARDRGLTLVELLIVISMMAVLLTIAIPAYSTMLVRQRLTSQANIFLAALHLARSEAIKRNSRVVVCKSSTGTECAAGGSWQQGWIVFDDANNNASLDSDETVLRYDGTLGPDFSMTGNTMVATYISYTPLGITKMSSGAFQAGTVTLCRSGATGAEARQVVLGITGRPRINKTTIASCP